MNGVVDSLTSHFERKVILSGPFNIKNNGVSVFVFSSEVEIQSKPTLNQREIISKFSRSLSFSIPLELWLRSITPQANRISSHLPKV
jgi:hypothetical protein